ncbi:hypothetical protein E2C01_011221 [Portunus trituberculatus]|uniref:Uncharacterized protein n=1 Tax=Portunus trituberculatus TaxID=210409 RepID=A0A5B7DAN6_PORTR|nr:hypothetical protein [Portunus trituberculatus]
MTGQDTYSPVSILAEDSPSPPPLFLMFFLAQATSRAARDPACMRAPRCFILSGVLTVRFSLDRDDLSGESSSSCCLVFAAISSNASQGMTAADVTSASVSAMHSVVALHSASFSSSCLPVSLLACWDLFVVLSGADDAVSVATIGFAGLVTVSLSCSESSGTFVILILHCSSVNGDSIPSSKQMSEFSRLLLLVLTVSSACEGSASWCSFFLAFLGGVMGSGMSFFGGTILRPDHSDGCREVECLASLLCGDGAFRQVLMTLVKTGSLTDEPDDDLEKENKRIALMIMSLENATRDTDGIEAC